MPPPPMLVTFLTVRFELPTTRTHIVAKPGKRTTKTKAAVSPATSPGCRTRRPQRARGRRGASGKRDRSDIGSPGSLSRRTTETILASCIAAPHVVKIGAVPPFPDLSHFPFRSVSLPVSDRSRSFSVPLSPVPFCHLANIGPVPLSVSDLSRFLCCPKYRTCPAFSNIGPVPLSQPADVFRAQPAGRFAVADGFRELLACLRRAILPEAENRKRALDAAEVGSVIGLLRGEFSGSKAPQRVHSSKGSGHGAGSPCNRTLCFPFSVG
jgi:hypothetical protein